MKIGRLTVPIPGRMIVLEDLELTLDELEEIIKGIEKLLAETTKPVELQGSKIPSVA